VSLKDIIESYDPNAPLAEASTIPSTWYVDPALAELERQTVFARSWQVIGRAEQVANPGQYVTSEVAGEPLAVIRGSDGVLRGFFNVCRHHAAAVLTELHGETSQMRCPYHGWTYSLEGELKSAPDLGAVCNFDRASMGLRPLETSIWKQWALVRLDGAGAAGADMPSLDVGHFHWFERRQYTLACNWKVFVDNYLDGGYHVPHLHRGLDSVLHYSEYQIDPGERFCLQWSRSQAASSAVLLDLSNWMINRYPDAMDTNLVIPRGIARTEVIFDFYFTNISEAARARNVASVARSEEIQNEDVGICESVQRGLASRAYTAGRLSARREAGEHLFHRLLCRLKSGI
jgi:choline monooxygenase